MVKAPKAKAYLPASVFDEPVVEAVPETPEERAARKAAKAARKAAKAAEPAVPEEPVKSKKRKADAAVEEPAPKAAALAPRLSNAEYRKEHEIKARCSFRALHLPRLCQPPCADGCL